MRNFPKRSRFPQTAHTVELEPPSKYCTAVRHASPRVQKGDAFLKTECYGWSNDRTTILCRVQIENSNVYNTPRRTRQNIFAAESLGRRLMDSRSRRLILASRVTYLLLVRSHAKGLTQY